MKKKSQKPGRRGIAWAAALVLATLSSGALGAQDRDLGREKVTGAILVSAGIQFGSVIEAFAFDEEYFPWLFLGTVSLQGLPGLALGSDGAIPSLALQLGADALCLGNHALFGHNYLDPILFNTAHKLSMYQSYALYAGLRRDCSDEAYASSFKGYSLVELASAPFSADVLGQPYVWGSIAAVAAVGAITLLASDQDDAVWTRGESWLDETALPVWAGLGLTLISAVYNFTVTAIGEESLYRGLYYEEMKTSVGLIPAKILDANYFVLSHYPQRAGELSSKDWKGILTSYALSICQTLWLECIYDWGGLRAAVAVHAWDDVIFGLVDWLLSAGRPYSDNSGFLLVGRGAKMMSLGVTIRL